MSYALRIYLSPWKPQSDTKLGDDTVRDNVEQESAMDVEVDVELARGLQPVSSCSCMELKIELYGRQELKKTDLLCDRLPQDRDYKLLSSFTSTKDVEFYLSITRTPLEVLTHTCSLLIDLKLSLLEKRIALSAQHSNQSLHAIVQAPLSLMVYITAKAGFLFRVDNRSGKLLSSSFGFGDYSGPCTVFDVVVDVANAISIVDVDVLMVDCRSLGHYRSLSTGTEPSGRRSQCSGPRRNANGSNT
jgi:hypothetical protein